MLFNIILLLAFDLRILAFNYSPYGEETQGNQVAVIDYNTMGQGVCPQIKQPLCATNGQQFLYFDNRCQLEVKNYEQLLQGLQEFYECPLSFCSPQCAPCGLVHEPVCAIDIQTQQRETFANPCEVERKTCTTQKVYSIIASGACPPISSYELKCPQFCTSKYNPVCAQYQYEIREFPNECELQKQKCETQKNWQMIDLNDCAFTKGNDVIQPLELTATKSECPEFCTLEYKPICARFMSLEKEFGNECELQTTICQTKQEWTIIRQGPCVETEKETTLISTTKQQQCPLFCTLEFNPICAIFNNELRQFSNRCALESTICQTQEKWEIVFNGTCLAFEEMNNTKCPEICPLVYRPICARLKSVLREFANDCELQSTICQTQEQWEVVYNGTCLSYNAECPQFCTLEFNPICATFNGELREFGNNCELESTICQTQEKWVIVNQGPCLVRTPAKSSNCPQSCTKEYLPVCAEFNKELKEFSNKCVLLLTICETNQKWEVVNLGPCSTKCPKICTKEFEPVCAVYNNVRQQFSNKCLLEKTNCELDQDWKIVHMGLCPLKSEACPLFCTKEFNLICAKYGQELREFDNTCLLTKAICETGKEWEIVKQGSCSTEASCFKICTDDFVPVCAEFDSEFREFHNECNLERTICETNIPWKKVPLNLCTSNFGNTKTVIFEPVCASNGKENKTFKSILELPGADWTVIHQGECHVTIETKTTTETTPKTTIKTKYTSTTTPKTTTSAPRTTSLQKTTQYTTTKPSISTQSTTPSSTTPSSTTTTSTYKTTKSTTTTTMKPTTTAKTTTTTKHLYDFIKSSEDCSKEHLNCCNCESLEDIEPYSEESFEDDLDLSWESEEDEDNIYTRALMSNKTASYVNSYTQKQNKTNDNGYVKGNPLDENIYQEVTANSTDTKPEKYSSAYNTSESAKFSFKGNENLKYNSAESRESLTTTSFINKNPVSYNNKPTDIQRTSAINIGESVTATKEDKSFRTKSKVEENNTLQNQATFENVVSNDIQTKLPYNPNYSSAIRKENEPKFGVFSNEAYSLNSLYQNNPHKNQNNQVLDYAKSNSLVNDKDDVEQKLLNVYEVLLTDSDSEEEEDEDDEIALVNKVLTTLATEKTSAAYPIFEKHESQLINQTKRQEYAAEYNATVGNKKGEIYNGAVYKAPVYDAPTYNFIYTAPNQPILPWLVPGVLPNSHDLQNKQHKTSEAVAEPNVSFNPIQFLNSLASVRNQEPNNHLSVFEHQPLYPYTAMSPFTFNPILPQMQPRAPQTISPPITNSFLPTKSDVSQVKLPLNSPEYQNSNEVFQQNDYQSFGNSKYLPLFSFSSNKKPYQTFNPLMSASEHKNIAISPLLQRDLKHVPYDFLKSHNPAFNSTVFKQILENLKTLPKHS